MKNIFYILLLFPTIIFAQYPSNSGQKITLGEQSTADGLVWRGIRADTTSKIVPFSDTSAYIILDTVEKTLWLYKAGQIPKWQQVGGSTLDTGTMLLPYWRSGRFSGVLPVANGGTNTGTAFTQGSVVFAGASGTYTQDNSGLFYNSTNKRLAVGQSQTLTGATLSVRGGLHIIDPDTLKGADASMYIYPKEQTTAGPNASEFAINLSGPGSVNTNDGPSFVFRGNNYNRIINQRGLLYFSSGTTGVNSTGDSTKIPAGGLNGKILFYAQHGVDFTVNGTDRMNITSAGNVGIGTASLPSPSIPTERLHVVGNARITGAYNVPTASAANVFVTTTGVLQRSTSSIKYKTDVEDYSKGLKEVMQLRPVTFKSINSNNDKTYAGFIAEELADLKLNELVENNDNDEPDAISYAYMVTLLTKAIQEQQEQISQLKKRLLILENK